VSKTLLTPAERKALRLSEELGELMVRILVGPNAVDDRRQTENAVRGIQHRIGRQAITRAGKNTSLHRVLEAINQARHARDPSS
jgi:hypothetical protein